LIENDFQLCQQIAKDLNILVIHGDGCDPRRMEEAGLQHADVLAAVTGSDEANLVICQLAKEISKVKRTVSRVNNPKNTHTFNEVGVDVAIDSTSIIAKVVEEEVSLEDLTTLMTFRKGKLSLVRVDLSKDSPCVNRRVMDLNIPHDSVLVSIIRGDEVTIPRGDTVLQAKDDVVALTTTGKERKLLDALIGKVE
jgi:trk system potassium uptake protein TrkA